MATPSSAGFKSAETSDKFQHRSLQEAFDECYREMQVRLRCFDRWVAEGRITASDATDRLQRMSKAVWALARMLDAPEDQLAGLLDPEKVPCA